MAISDLISGGVANLARSLIIPSLSVDVVAITAFGGFIPLLPNARPLAATVHEISQVMEHPLETGSVVADHIIQKPIEIELPLLCIGEFAYRSTYALLRTFYQSGTLLTIRTRTGSYSSMLIYEMPHEETSDIFDGIAIRLRLKEARFVTPKTGLAPAQVKDSKQASTTKRGSQQSSTPTTSNAARATETAAASGQGATPKGSTLYQWMYGE